MGLLRDKFVCVQEVIPGAQTTPEDLPAERRELLERFSHNGRFFFGTIRILSPDGKQVLGQLRSFPRADDSTRQRDRVEFLALAKNVSGSESGKKIEGTKPADPTDCSPRRFIPPIERSRSGLSPLRLGDGFGPPRKDSGFGLRSRGPDIGDKAPDFKLKFLASEKTFELSENRDKRPTLLIFHSFT